eukprot:TRINITY_DN2645_c0_g1_i6.p1 TRINITY_DN2645_c0_g1~~TRINITY_DN2645_c0_g1_i6.p1  ORF type:complete len:1095 (-),score=184.74 TRINITY_DN2645_c0_g1_i6:117-3401(-)
MAEEVASAEEHVSMEEYGSAGNPELAEAEFEEEAGAEDSGEHSEGQGDGVGASADGLTADARGDITVDSFEELRLNQSWVNDAQDAWRILVNSAASKEACADAIYSALFEASPAMQYLFTTPRAIAGGKFMAGIHMFVNGMSDPPKLKDQVETLAFGHLALEINIPRVVLFRDALLDLFQVELGSKFTPQSFSGIKALLNYVGGAIIYIKVYYNARIILLGESWGKANDKKTNKDKFATMGSIEVSQHQDAENSGEQQADHNKGGNKSESLVQNVPTTFKEMYQFNAAVMGFGANLWMNEVLACFENLVLNVANPSRLTEECDYIVCRISKVSTGKVNLSEFKSGMLASLRSLLPKDWTTQHEVAWSWLWDLVERNIAQTMGMPPKWEKAYAQFLDGIDEATGFNLRRDIYLRFFALSPAGQDYFKQSNTYLHLVSTKVLTMVLDLYREPVRMVDDISGVGLRHVGYGISTEFFGPFASATVEVIAGLTRDQTCVEGFNWSIGLISKSTVRTIIEGSTIVMKAINVNTRKSMSRALSNASRGERSGWMLLIQVGSQNISPLAWAIESGALDSAARMIEDLFTFRADRDRYYYACDETFTRHPNLVAMLLADAPSLLPGLLDGLIWRSRVTSNGWRRVNYYVKHLLIDPEGKFAKTLEWVIKSKDPKIVCHPVLVLISDIVWAKVACRTFLIRKAWFMFTLVVFIVSQSILSSVEKEEPERITTFVMRCFIYFFSLGGMLIAHSRRVFRAFRSNDTFRVLKVVPIPTYLSNWQDVANLALMVLLIILLATEPIIYCFQDDGGELFTDSCSKAEHIVVFNSKVSMFAVFLYNLLMIDLVVFSNRVSAYVLVCGRMLAEVGLFLLTLVVVLLTFSSSLSCLDQQIENFQGIQKGALALWELFLNIYSDADYDVMHKEAFVLIGAFMFIITSVIFLANLLIAQLTCAYGTIYADMVGYARIKRIRIIAESMPQVPPGRWDSFVTALAFEKKIEFNEGDVGVNNGFPTVEPASAHPTTADMIKRFGGSTSPDMQWPEENDGGSEADKFERLEVLIKRAMERLTKSAGSKKRAGGGGSTTGSAGQGDSGIVSSVDASEEK